MFHFPDPWSRACACSLTQLLSRSLSLSLAGVRSHARLPECSRGHFTFRSWSHVPSPLWLLVAQLSPFLMSWWRFFLVYCWSFHVCGAWLRSLVFEGGVGWRGSASSRGRSCCLLLLCGLELCVLGRGVLSVSLAFFLSLPCLAYKILCLTPLYMGAFYVSLYVCWCVCIDMSVCACLWVGIYFLIICLFLSWGFCGIGFVTLEAFFPTSLPCTAITFGGTLVLFPNSYLGVVCRRAVLWLALGGFLLFKRNKTMSRGLPFYGGLFSWG